MIPISPRGQIKQLLLPQPVQILRFSLPLSHEPNLGTQRFQAT